jgi:hypothetical protein
LTTGDRSGVAIVVDLHARERGQIRFAPGEG